jgi:hypothetical protein
VGARKFARSLKLRKRDHWREWVRKHRADLDVRSVPSRPDKAYRRSGWSGWSDWLGSNLFQPKPFMPYEQWIDWLRAQGFTRQTEYNDWCKDHPAERERLRIPSSPSLVYAKFRTWREELNQAAENKQATRLVGSYLPFAQARAFARALVRSAEWDALGYQRTHKGWQAYARDHRTVLNERHIPAAPDSVAQYRANWRGWRDFIGTNTRSTLNRKR